MTTTTFSAGFSDELTTNSPTYRRPGGESTNYHYLVQRLTVSISGQYFVDGSSSFAVCVYLYVESFDSSNPTANLVAQGQSNLNGRLRLSFYFQGFSGLSKRVCISFILEVVDFKLSSKRSASMRYRSKRVHK